MANDQEENESGEHQEGSASVTEASATTATAEMRVTFSADNIRERLDDDEYALALILTSTRLENILTSGIRNHIGMDTKAFEALWDRETLGTYGQMCAHLGVFGGDFEQKTVDDVARLRNNLVHDYGYLDGIEDDQEIQTEVTEVIEGAIEFIEKVEVREN